jgi:hypothetical protein
MVPDHFPDLSKARMLPMSITKAAAFRSSETKFYKPILGGGTFKQTNISTQKKGP